MRALLANVLLVAGIFAFHTPLAFADEPSGQKAAPDGMWIYDLNLNDQQEAKIADIHKEFAPKVQEAGKELATGVKEEVEKVRDVLTPEQKMRPEAAKEERQERRAECLAQRVAHFEDLDLTDDELAAFSWHGFRERVVRHSGKKNPTVRDFVEVSGRGTIAEHKVFCGTPKSVADQMEEWFTAPVCDGFVLAATHMPGAYEDVVRLLVPELQRRGLFQKDYAGPTLRDNLGLAIPRAADWHAARRAPVR